MYSHSSLTYNLANRCQTLENEIALQKKFDKEFYPAPPKRIKKTRWDFELLNMENQQIHQMARRAFDPANSFVSITPSSQGYDFINTYDDEYNESKMRPPISTPHRIADPTIFYKKRQMQMQQKEEDERERQKEKLYEKLEQRRNLIIEHVDYKKNPNRQSQSRYVPNRYYSNNNSYISDESRYKQKRKYHSEALSSRSKNSASDMDSTIDQFVDKIDDYKKW